MSGRFCTPRGPSQCSSNVEKSRTDEALGAERLREGDLTKVTQLGLGTVLLGLGPRSLTPLGHHIRWHGCVILGGSRPGPEP